MTRHTYQAILLHTADNVATALETIPPGTALIIRFGSRRYVVRALQAIPRGHKISLTTIRRRGPVVKYGEVIGVANRDIPAGTLVHIHNIDSQRCRGDKWQESAP